VQARVRGVRRRHGGRRRQGGGGGGRERGGGDAGGRRAAPHLERLSACCLSLLRGEAACQHDDESEGEGEGGEEAEAEDEEELLLGSVAELLPQVAAAVGPSFAPAFAPHFEALMRRAQPSRPEGERCLVSATLVDVVKHLGAAAAPCTERAMPFCLRELAVDSDDSRRNAAYCAGVLCEHAGAAARPFHPQLAASVAPLLVGGGVGQALRDNACGCAARLLAAHPGHSAFRDGLLAALLSALPVREDMDEAEPAYGYLCALLASEDASVASQVPRVVQVLGEAASMEDTPAACKAMAGGTLARLMVGYGPQLGPLLDALPGPHRDALSQAMAAAAPA